MVEPRIPSPAALAGQGHGLRRLFAQLSFRAKFIIVGVAVASPLCLLTGYTAASFELRVRQAEARQQALEQSQRARALMIAVATHRGLSARVLAGAEGASRQLVRHQQAMMALVAPMVEAFSTPEWAAIGLPDPEAMAEELRALLALPNAREPQVNFQRHNEVVDGLLAVVHRTGNRIAAAQEPTEGGAFDLSFVVLPALMEDVGRQRGWGSAVLQEGGHSEFEVRELLQYAGALRQRLALTRADRHTLREVQALVGQPDQPDALVTALNDVEAFGAWSLGQVLARSSGDEVSAEHFRLGTQAIEALRVVNQALDESLRASTARALSEARWGRNASLAVLALLLLGLGWVYREFERSTVLRLRSLQSASTRLARGDFDDTVPVEGGDEIAALATTLDTMRRRLREAVAESAVALAARESDRAKTEFLARWSHDLRTPLAAVLGFAELLGERGSALAPEQRADLDRIRNAGRHLLALVNDVLEIARADASGLPLADEPVALAPVLDEALDLLGPEAAALGVELRPAPREAAALWVRGDRTRLLQVFANLVGNAVKFNRRGGHVALELGTPAAPHEAGASNLAITVMDSGPGIAPESLSRLFRPFERLDAAQRGIVGSGLGLATVKRLVEGMGGRVAAHSVLGEGSRFVVELRRVDAPVVTPVAAAPSPAGSDAPLLAGRVAYVEDDPVNVVLMQAMLEGRTAIELTALGSVAEALADRGEYDLWIVDHRLPDGDGLALLQRLSELRGARLRAVMFSADALPQLRERALAAGCLDFWTKPLQLDHLLASLRRLLPPR